jgi:hypothetical protein
MRYTTKVWCHKMFVLTKKEKKKREVISSSINELDGDMLSEYAWNLSHGPDTCVCDPIFPSVDARPSMSSVSVLQCIHRRFTDASRSAS